MNFRFCQAPTADRWHIRRVTNGTKRRVALEQEVSLCGKAVKWDLSLPLTFNRLALCCADCAALYAVEEDKGQ